MYLIVIIHATSQTKLANTFRNLKTIYEMQNTKKLTNLQPTPAPAHTPNAIPIRDTTNNHQPKPFGYRV